MNDQLEKGIIERVPIEETSELENVHFMPHHAVVRQDRETTKLRVVYDGSAKEPQQTHSINDLLETGPNYIPKLMDVLVKFRSHLVTVNSDIEKAFLMIGINQVDRDMLRLLWLKDPFVSNSEIVQLRFCSLVFGLRPSPAILGATIEHHLNTYENKYPQLVQQNKESLYVDDFLSGEDSVEKAVTLYRKSKQIMGEEGFNLRKWHSNSKELISIINAEEPKPKNTEQEIVSEEDESFAKATVGPVNSTANNLNDELVKVLGTLWNTETDQFLFNFDEIIEYAKSLPVAKRSVLKVSAKIFDPLGLLSGFTITLKCLFQSFCVDKIGWDDVLQGSYLKQWNDLLMELKALGNVSVPRCYFDSKPVNVQLHCFSDDSKKACGALVYVRSEYTNGRVDVKLVAGKTKVAPIKEQTIPHSELLGATILARLARESLKLSDLCSTTFWVDSSTVLFWILNDKPWKQYVQHRVGEIRELTAQDKWDHCPGELNPADLASRGISGPELVYNSLWWNGPAFLGKPKSEWPSFAQKKIKEDDVLKEMMKCPPRVTHSLLNQDQTVLRGLPDVIEINKFSSLTRLLRVTAYCLKFVKLLKLHVQRAELSIETELTASEIEIAESLWIKEVQSKSFPEECLSR